MFNIIFKIYFLFLFKFERKLNSSLQYIYYLLYFQGNFVNYYILYNYKNFKYTSIDNTIILFLYLDKKTIIIKCNFLNNF